MISCMANSQSISPYSYFGLGEVRLNGFAHNEVGEVRLNGFAHNEAMGGLAIPLYDSSHINLSNPASLSGLRFTSYEFGIDARGIKQETSTSSQQSFEGSLSYLALAFPITKRWGLSASIVPYTNMRYRFIDTVFNTGLQQLHKFGGNGTVYKVNIGNGYQIFPLSLKEKSDKKEGESKGGRHSLSFGANASLLFGQLNDTISIEYPQDSNIFNVRKIEGISIQGFTFDYGALYSMRLDDNLHLRIGVKGALPVKVNATRDAIWESYEYINGFATVVKDTIPNSSKSDEKGKIYVPSFIGMGFAVEKKHKWLIGAEFQYNKWSEFKIFDKNDSLVDNWTARIGVQYTPDYRNTKQYLKAIQYRFGFFYGTDYVFLRSTQINKIGVSFGMGLPLNWSNKNINKRGPSQINIGAVIGQSGTTQNDLVKEQFIRFTFALTLNSRWFRRSAIE